MASNFIGQASLPIGLRNNNPGDFKTTDGIHWQGTSGADGIWVTFADVSWGLRAMAKDLINNIDNEGFDTITKFITKYAPPSENDTAAYIAYVSQQTGIGPNDQLGDDNDTLHSMIRAIINRELGSPYAQMIQDADIDQGIQMAQGGVSTLPAAAGIALENNSGGATVALAVAVIAILAFSFRRG